MFEPSRASVGYCRASLCVVFRIAAAASVGEFILLLLLPLDAGAHAFRCTGTACRCRNAPPTRNDSCCLCCCSSSSSCLF